MWNRKTKQYEVRWLLYLRVVLVYNIYEMWKNLNVELQLSKDKELNEIGSEIYKMMRSFEHKAIAKELWISPSTLSQIFIKSRRTTARIKFDKFRLTMFYWYLLKVRDTMNSLLEKIEKYLYNN